MKSRLYPDCIRYIFFPIHAQKLRCPLWNGTPPLQKGNGISSEEVRSEGICQNREMLANPKTIDSITFLAKSICNWKTVGYFPGGGTVFSLRLGERICQMGSILKALLELC